jgi:hypothetical protein
MKINIPTTRELVYKQYLTILNPVFGKARHLDPQEIEILSKFLYINYKYKHLDDSKRNTLLFHTETRKRIRLALGISVQVFNNKLTSLRKKKFITKDKLVFKVEEDSKTNSLPIHFNLNIDDKS